MESHEGEGAHALLSSSHGFLKPFTFPWSTADQKGPSASSSQGEAFRDHRLELAQTTLLPVEEEIDAQYVKGMLKNPNVRPKHGCKLLDRSHPPLQVAYMSPPRIINALMACLDANPYPAKTTITTTRKNGSTTAAPERPARPATQQAPPPT
jgi:hypothetical protein